MVPRANVNELPNKYGKKKWVFDVPLLFKSLAATVVVAILLLGFYAWRSSQIGAQVRLRAEDALAKKDYRKQAAWLARGISLDPNDKQAIIALGFAADNAVESINDLITARKRLGTAIATTGDLAEFDSARADLRRRLIKRLLQISRLAPGEWANEAERQITELNAAPDDAEALKWLAEALAIQLDAGESPKTEEVAFDKSKDYWRWLANQPIGHALYAAWLANPTEEKVCYMFANTALRNLEWFSNGEETPSGDKIKQDAATAINTLASNVESGYAQLRAFELISGTDRTRADQQLMNSFPLAIKRLQSSLKSAKDEKSQRWGEILWNGLLTAEYAPANDWQLALDGAATAATSSGHRELAQRTYDQLRELAPMATKSAAESYFSAAGLFLWNNDQRDAAVGVWAEGIKQLESSLKLQRLVARAQVDLNHPAADESVAALAQVIDSENTRLNGPEVVGLSTAQQNLLRSNLDLARWEFGLIKARQLMKAAKYRDAVASLKKNFVAIGDFTDTQRVEVGLLLVECYQQLQLWDLASLTIDQCVQLQPSRVPLRRMSAEFARRQGAIGRAQSQADAIDDGSFQAAIEIAQLRTIALVNNAEAPRQTADAGPTIDSSTAERVKPLFAEARKRWQTLSDDQKKAQPLWTVDLTEVAAEPDRDRRFQRVSEIADANPDVQALQVTLAREALSAGKLDKGKLAVERLTAMAKPNANDPSAALDATLWKMRLLEAEGQIDQALSLARDAAAGDLKLPLANEGLQIAVRNNRVQEGYELLKNVGEEKLDVAALIILGQMSGSVFLDTEGAEKRQADYARWESKLQAIEGEDGCSWRYVRAQKLLAEALTKTAGSQARKQLVDQAQREYSEIDRQRPRWGAAASLGGMLALELNQPQVAIDRFRRAIQEGDNNVTTSQRLIRLLLATGQFDQAEAESRRLMKGQEDSSQAMNLQMEMHSRKGDYRQTLDVARRAVTANPSDVGSWLAAYQSAITVAKMKNVKEEERKELQQQAGFYLDQAQKLTEGKDIRVWNARFRYQVAIGSTEGAKKELADLNQSKIPRMDALLQSAIWSAQLNDFTVAQDYAQKAIQLDPKSALPHNVLYQIHQRLGDRKSMIASLEASYKLDSKNADIRERLAMAKALETAEVPWHEIDELLREDPTSNSNRLKLLRANIALNKGDVKRVEEAVSTLKQLAALGERESIEAKRFLSSYYARRWVAMNEMDRDSPDGLALLDNAKAGFQDLLNLGSTDDSDVLNLANLAILEKQFSEAELLISRLERDGTSLAALQLKIRLAKARGEIEKVSSIANDWIAAAAGLKPSQSFELVGRTLAELGFAQESLGYLERAYKENPERYGPYTVALARQKQMERALAICLERYAASPELEQALRLLEVEMVQPGDFLVKEVEKVVAESLNKFPTSAELFESVGTIRLLREEYVEAASLLETADKLSANRPRTVNNLAIALAEIPMRGEEAILRINKALQTFNRAPELLDTLAIVQAKLGKLAEAKATLSEAISNSSEIRFKMRLVDVLLAMGNQQAAKQEWSNIDLPSLEKAELIRTDQRMLQKLIETLGRPQ